MKSTIKLILVSVCVLAFVGCDVRIVLFESNPEKKDTTSEQTQAAQSRPSGLKSSMPNYGKSIYSNHTNPNNSMIGNNR